MGTVQTWTEVGERVREAREAAGITQGQLADLVDLDRTAPVRVESGQRQLNAMELFRLADVLGVPLAHLVSQPPRAMFSRRQAMRAQPTAAGRTRFRLDVALAEHARNTAWLLDTACWSRPPLLP